LTETQGVFKVFLAHNTFQSLMHTYMSDFLWSHCQYLWLRGVLLVLTVWNSPS